MKRIYQTHLSFKDALTQQPPALRKKYSLREENGKLIIKTDALTASYLIGNIIAFARDITE